MQDGATDAGPEISEAEALKDIAEAVDVSNVVRLGDGPTMYAYGYPCAPDRVKIGLTTGDTVQRIAAQIGTGTPDRPSLLLEVRTHDCGSLEGAIHAILTYRGAKIDGAGKEWFRASRDDVLAIYRSVTASGAEEISNPLPDFRLG